ncbi:MAG: hypothetical protein KY462_08900 [Actinobacteria bacterium]|nr:hypothetical protein [Actinomycetota bacterium]
MTDDAHRVTFAEVDTDNRCWGSGTTGLGCDREATLAVGLCRECHAAISTRVEQGRAPRRPALPPGGVIEVSVVFGDGGELVDRVVEAGTEL